jgi:hypothetical protein
VGFLRESERVGRVLQRPFRVPACLNVTALLIVFSRSAMGTGGKFVLFSGFPMCIVHECFLQLENAVTHFSLARVGPILYWTGSFLLVRIGLAP